MAGVAGRSGGANITLKGAETRRRQHEPFPEEKAKAFPDWFMMEGFRIYSRKEIFDRLAEELHSQGITAREDGRVLGMLAQQYEVLQHATKAYDTDGPTALLGRNLASKLMTDAQKEIRILLGEFYLTPTTRNKRPRDATKEADPLDAFLSLT